MNIKEICLEINSLVRDLDKKSVNIMEVCGTHTMEIARNGLKQLLPPEINLISGPGCPVCVTPTIEIDRMIEIIKNYDITVFSFGDMIKVPGSSSSLAHGESFRQRYCYLLFPTRCPIFCIRESRLIKMWFLLRLASRPPYH